MVTHGRVELLAHPLSQKYLQMKWNSYGKYFHLANLLFYTIFLTFVTAFTAHLIHDEMISADTYNDVNNTTNGTSNGTNEEVNFMVLHKDKNMS